MCCSLWRFLTGRTYPHDHTTTVAPPSARHATSPHHQPETSRQRRYEPVDNRQPCHDFYFAVVPPTTTANPRKRQLQHELQPQSRPRSVQPSFDVEMWRRRVSASQEREPEIEHGDPFPESAGPFGQAWVSGSYIYGSNKSTTAAASTAVRRKAVPVSAEARAAVETKTAARRGCVVCLEDLDGSRFAVRALHDGTVSSHADDACLSCWKKHIRLAVEGNGTDVRCISSGCRASLTEQEVKRRASPTRYTRYLDNLTLATLRSDPQYRECPSADCKYGVLHEGGHIFQCHACGYRYCTACEVPMHEGLTCSQYISRKQRSVKDRATEVYLQKHTKACPNCTIHIKKDGGCDHMTCTTCRHEFCWPCLAPYAGARGIRLIGNSAHGAECLYRA